MENPKFTFVDHIRHYYINGGFQREISTWIWVARYYWIIIFGGGILLLALIFVLKPISFKTTYLANGQSGTVSNIMSQEFQKIFYKMGLPLKLVNTSGLNEGFTLLEEKGSKVNASFYPAGLDSSNNHPNIVSLGSVQTAPIWLFYRGSEVKTDDPFTYFSTKKISIGNKGTTNHTIFNLLAKATLRDGDYSSNFLELRYLDAEKKLLDGEIDAMFFIQDFESPIAQRLLKDPNIKLYNFNLADAYIKNFPFLSKLIIPRGAIDIKELRPPESITLLATTINLLVENNMHASAQWALLMAAKKVDENGKFFFTAPGTFPKYLDQSFPLSPIAERYYQDGIPTVFSYLPIRLATIFDQIWVQTLTLLVAFSLFFGKLLGLRKLISEKVLNTNTAWLRELKQSLDHAKSTEEINLILEKVRTLNEKMKSVWCEPSFAWGHIEFEFAINEIQKIAQEKIIDLKKATNSH